LIQGLAQISTEIQPLPGRIVTVVVLDKVRFDDSRSHGDDVGDLPHDYLNGMCVDYVCRQVSWLCPQGCHVPLQ
jgi:hypothetical protein